MTDSPQEPSSAIVVSGRVRPARIAPEAPHSRRDPLQLVKDRQPWERQPGETGRGYEAFRVYRDLGLKRTQVRTAGKLSKNLTTIAGWAQRNQWKQRAEAWDVEQDRLTRASLMGEVIAAQRVRLQHGSTMIRRASADLAKTKRALSPMEAARIAEVGGKLTQVATGAQRSGPTITVEQAVFALAQDRADPRSVTD